MDRISISFRRYILLPILVACAVLLYGCGEKEFDDIRYVDRDPVVYPDYQGVTIPPNIAPMNFLIREEGNYFRVDVMLEDSLLWSVTSRKGIIRFPENQWRTLLEKYTGKKVGFRVAVSKKEEYRLDRYRPFYMQVAEEPVDPFLVYRLIHPGYYNWYRMSIVQRSLESFREFPVAVNRLLDHNCINCHTFRQNDPDQFLLHVRGSRGGTYFHDGEEVIRTELQTEEMSDGATYPSWHPEGRYVAFSSNSVRQGFYALPGRNIEVFDLASSLVLYDTEKNEMHLITGHESAEYMETFPCWSPDGRYLYFSRTGKPDEEITAQTVKNIRYDLARIPFDPESGKFGESETVFHASDLQKSASYANISPCGRFLAFTLHDYGTFPAWNREADIYLMDLQTGEYMRPDFNSNETESYHAWSSNGKWLVFSSKRKDGQSARPYFAYVGHYGVTGKPFVLPQDDPAHYTRMLRSFNLPELVTGRISAGPRDFERVSTQRPVTAQPAIR